MKKNNKLYSFWFSHNDRIVLFVLLIIFMGYSVFVALHTQRGIIPDEVAHFAFSKYYASTWGIPADSQETYQYGWYIKQNPFLYYWLNGRALNLLNIVFPFASDWQQLIFLRLISSIYTLGTVYFCYLLSKEVINHKWWQLLPVFLLTNTLMFVFLSGGVNYDNLANLFSMAGLYFLVRVFNGKEYISNSLGWMICICLGTLVKYPIVPLALAMGVAWIIFIIIGRKKLSPINIRQPKLVALFGLLLILFSINVAIYGVNIVKYKALTPKCADLLSEEQCAISPFAVRFEEIGLDHKLTIQESIQMGFPNPIKYFFDGWIDFMFYRMYGILAHISYFPTQIIIFYKILYILIFILGIKYIEKPPLTLIYIIAIIVFYMTVLFINNYNSELIYGFKQIALQGRYIFPIIGLIYSLFPYILMKVKNKPIKIISLIFGVCLFFLGGPLKFIILYNQYFHKWFII